MRSGGRIVSISASFQGAPIVGYGPYAASKMAIEKMTEVAAKEFGAKGITVNSIRPGPTNTTLFTTGKTPELLETFSKQAALGRIGEPEDIANVVSLAEEPEILWRVRPALCKRNVVYLYKVLLLPTSCGFRKRGSSRFLQTLAILRITS